jgi:hypothetical protein
MSVELRNDKMQKLVNEIVVIVGMLIVVIVIVMMRTMRGTLEECCRLYIHCLCPLIHLMAVHVKTTARSENALLSRER